MSGGSEFNFFSPFDIIKRQKLTSDADHPFHTEQILLTDCIYKIFEMLIAERLWDFVIESVNMLMGIDLLSIAKLRSGLFRRAELV